MKRIFLYGDVFLNSGPSNVNKSLIANSEGTLLSFKHENRLLKSLELLWNLQRADLIIMSGGCSLSRLHQIKKLSKHTPIVYLMHGNLEYENRINRLDLSEDALHAEIELMETASRIVCVSERYAHWVSDKYPQYRRKICFVNNGLELKLRPPKKKIPFSIALSGGNRMIKNNRAVCEAVEKLIAEDFPCNISLFGRLYPNNDDLLKYPFVSYKGQLGKEEYYQNLDQCSLFILNSTLESFGIAVGDALNCRCSILLSDSVGAGSILTLNETDRIRNPDDLDTLAEKIKFTLLHSNAERLWNSLDIQACSGKQAFLNLKKICDEILA